jgi:hypothetical protein
VDQHPPSGPQAEGGNQPVPEGWIEQFAAQQAQCRRSRQPERTWSAGPGTNFRF